MLTSNFSTDVPETDAETSTSGNNRTSTPFVASPDKAAEIVYQRDPRRNIANTFFDNCSTGIAPNNCAAEGEILIIVVSHDYDPAQSFGDDMIL